MDQPELNQPERRQPDLDQPESEGTRIVLRRRRTRRHRRNRRIRRVLLVVCAALTFAFSSVALRYLTPSLFQAARPVEPSRPSIAITPSVVAAAQRESMRAVENRPVYPYSVVPGGVRNVRELKWAAEHDPVVAEHYAGFDYDHARVVRLTLARTVFVSYRIGKKVYWTRHRVSLKKGEELITDGRMTARTRCANRVEEVPQQAASESEPPVAKFEEPILPSLGTAVAQPPVPFESSLNRPAPALGPAPPVSMYDPFTVGTVTPMFPPALPSVCGITPKKPGTSVGGDPVEVSGHSKKKTVNPCGNGGGGATEVPEPGTWLLMASGLAAIYWKARQRFSRA